MNAEHECRIASKVLTSTDLCYTNEILKNQLLNRNFSMRWSSANGVVG